MRIIIDIPSYQVNSIRKHVVSGTYSSISDFVLNAIENQIAIELVDIEKGGNLENEDRKKYQADYSFPVGEVPLLEIPKQKVSENIWDDMIWGQINRFLPIKFSARLLSMSSSEPSGFPELKDFCILASKKAKDFGEYLKISDLNNPKPRDEKLFAGFPIGSNTEKSIERYWSQFIGYRSKQGKLHGGLFDYSFASITQIESNRYSIGLSREGLQFAKITNPVIDGQDFSKALSIKEKEFITDHVKKHIPGERNLFDFLLNKIKNGVSDREELNTALFSAINNNELSKGFISTQRSGAFSRMYELDLIRKEKAGLFVKYFITDFGKRFLAGV